MKKRRRTKKEIEKESNLIYCDITDALSYMNYRNEKDIKEQVNEYRTNYTDLDTVSISQVRKVLNIMIGEGLVKKRKENYKYV
mgnify:CR=1 FL=1|tara:strand:+ start:645 stop:893 length:249 start_codon:yes stop_codon:yes gene_type:complete